MEGERMDAYTRRTFIGRAAVLLAGSAAGGRSALSACEAERRIAPPERLTAGETAGVPFQMGMASYTFGNFPWRKRWL